MIKPVTMNYVNPSMQIGFKSGVSEEAKPFVSNPEVNEIPSSPAAAYIRIPKKGEFEAVKLQEKIAKLYDMVPNDAKLSKPYFHVLNDNLYQISIDKREGLNRVDVKKFDLNTFNPEEKNNYNYIVTMDFDKNNRMIYGQYMKMGLDNGLFEFKRSRTNKRDLYFYGPYKKYIHFIPDRSKAWTLSKSDSNVIDETALFALNKESLGIMFRNLIELKNTIYNLQ